MRLQSIDAPEEYTPPPKMSKQAQAAATLRVMLESEPMKATEVQAMFSRADIGERTLLAVKKEMGIPSALLEHVAARIAKAIFKEFDKAKEVVVEIIKVNPPMGAQCEGAGVRETFTRHDTTDAVVY